MRKGTRLENTRENERSQLQQGAAALESFEVRERRRAPLERRTAAWQAAAAA